MNDIEFDKVYTSHRVAQYGDWVIVEPAEAPTEFYAFLPEYQLDDEDFEDLDYLRDFMDEGLQDDDLEALVAAIDNSGKYR